MSRRLHRIVDRTGPVQGAVKPGTEPGLESTRYFGPPRGTAATSVHAMLIEIDAETLAVKILKYAAVHDCGTVRLRRQRFASASTGSSRASSLRNRRVI